VTLLSQMSDIETRYERYFQLHSKILFQFYLYSTQNSVDKAPAVFLVREVPWVAPNLWIINMICVFFFCQIGLLSLAKSRIRHPCCVCTSHFCNYYKGAPIVN